MKNFLTKILELVFATLWLLNAFAGLVGGVWLAVTGGLWLVVAGLLAGFAMPFGYSIASLPTLLIAPLIVKFEEKGSRFGVMVTGFIMSVYTNFLMYYWVSLVFSWLVLEGSYALLPLLLWGYSVVMGPVGYMAQKEGPNAGMGTTLGVLFAQLYYILFSASYLLGADLGFGSRLGLTLVLIFSVVTSGLSGAMVVPKHATNNTDESYLPFE